MQNVGEDLKIKKFEIKLFDIKKVRCANTAVSSDVPYKCYARVVGWKEEMSGQYDPEN